METSGQFLSPTRQEEIQPFLTAERPVVGFSEDYPAGLATGMHSHPRAQLLYAVSGVMRVDTDASSFTIVPRTALLLPADVSHAVQMDGSVAMRGLFLNESAVQRLHERTKVITISPLLRELIIAVCAEPLEWDLAGRGHHLAELILDEINQARKVPLELPMPHDTRARRVALAVKANTNDKRSFEDWALLANASSRTLARLFRAETGLSFRQWRLQARMTEALNAINLGANLARAASIAGFKSQSAFGAAFRQLFGMAPGQMLRHSFEPGKAVKTARMSSRHQSVVS